MGMPLKRVLSSLVSGLLLTVSCSIVAQESATPSYGEKVKAKAGSGVVNIVSAPVEIPKSIINTTNESNFIFGIVGGAVEGLLNTAGRVANGVSDLLTAPVPTRPVVYPERVWDDMNADTTYGDIFIADDR